jgi:uncharacterized protein (TIGR02596 family)
MKCIFMNAQHRSPQPAAFTLSELLIVIGVLSLLLVVAGPSLFNSTSSSHLTTTGDLLIGRLSEAQQEAIASNNEVEVRFFEEIEAVPADSAPKLRSFQLLKMASGDEAGNEGAYIPTTSVTHFAPGIVISPRENLSSLMQTGYKSAEGSAPHSQGRYLSLRFLPDGSTNLAEGSPWFLTLVSEESELETAEEVPANFYAIQVDPVTGRTRSFRPD